MFIKSELKEICLKLATNGRSDKGFLLTSEVCPQGVFCPCPGAIYMYKIIFRRDHFETCNIWAKRKGLSIVIKILSPGAVCPCLGLYTYGGTCKKMYIIGLEAFFFKPATNGQSDKGFLLTSKVCPQGLSALAPGLYTYIKSLKMCIKSDFFF